MRKTYIAAQAQENGKLYAYAIPVAENTNILSVIARHKNLIAANICETKKRANEFVNLWNNQAKQNGCFMFRETF